MDAARLTGKEESDAPARCTTYPYRDRAGMNGRMQSCVTTIDHRLTLRCPRARQMPEG